MVHCTLHNKACCHCGLQVLDRKQADVFYADALGLTRDSAMQGHPRVTWYNIGRQQVPAVSIGRLLCVVCSAYCEVLMAFKVELSV